MPTRSLRIKPGPRAELPKKGPNLSLWFQKYLNRKPDQPTQALMDNESQDSLLKRFRNRKSDQPAQALMDSITKSQQQVDPVYVNYYNRWVAHLHEIGSAIEVAATTGRMVINLGAESVSEVSIALHHTYGVPFIPGTALKGLAAHYANSNMGAEWKKGTDAYKAIFGTGKTAGYVTFHDALFVPEDNNALPLKKDVVTGHHQNYNKGDNVPPADWDSPNIIPFISVHGKFLIAVSGDEKAKSVAMEILRLALLNEGIGAKTSSGYGRMIFVGEHASSQPGCEKTAPMDNTETYEVQKVRLLKEDPPTGWERGTVTDLKSDGRLGIINPAKGGKPVSVHINGMQEGTQPKIGQVLEYRIVAYKGKPQADDVKILLER